MATREEFDLNIDGVKLRCMRETRGKNRPTIIFLHESFGCIRHWRNFPSLLGEATGYNTLVYDRQGYGDSDPFPEGERTIDYHDKEVRVLDKILEALDIPDAVLFGHSDGATIALLAAAEHPQRIRAVISEGAHLFVEEVTRNGIRQAEELYLHSDLKRKLAFYHGKKTEKVFRLWADTWLNDEYRDWNIEHRLKGITCPVLIVQGEHDEYGSIRQVESIENNTSGITARCMPETGHTPHRDATETVIEAVKNLLSTRCS